MCLQDKVNHLICKMYYLEKGLDILEVTELLDDSSVLLFIVENCTEIPVYQSWIAPRPLGLGLQIPIEALRNAERAGAVCELSGYSPALGVSIAEVSLSFSLYKSTWFLIKK